MDCSRKQQLITRTLHPTQTGLLKSNTFPLIYSQLFLLRQQDNRNINTSIVNITNVLEQTQVSSVSTNAASDRCKYCIPFIPLMRAVVNRAESPPSALPVLMMSIALLLMPLSLMILSYSLQQQQSFYYKDTNKYPLASKR